MLTEIYIKNYLMLPEIRLPFEPGLTVLTGETGAGKSILVGSISLIFGDNSSGLEAYDKEHPIYLEASFRPNDDPQLLSLLRDSGFADEDEVVLAREVNPSGKSTYYLGGRKVSLSLMKELKPYMIDFHHQRDQQKLLNPAYQLELLDAYAGTSALREEFTYLYRQIKAEQKELSELHKEIEQQKQLQELYQFQYTELESAKLVPGEDSSLQQEYELLSHAMEINALSQSITQGLFEQENSIYDQISSNVAQLSRFAELNHNIKEASDALTQALSALQEASAQLGEIKDTLSADPDRLDFIQARLDSINGLLYKHKVRSIDDLLQLFSQRAAQLGELSQKEETASRLGQQLQENISRLADKGDALSAKRTYASKKLKAELETAIRNLSIPNGVFEIRIDKKGKAEKILSEYIHQVTESGQDSVQFLFSANLGFEQKPLAAVASGGELSRILLAIKKVLASKMPEKLIILDEIDSGIGGKTAAAVAAFISELSRKHRILCITHLAQIAAVADCHVAISKDKAKLKSTVSMCKLIADDRLHEIARMLSGNISTTALEHAKELINNRI